MNPIEKKRDSANRRHLHPIGVAVMILAGLAGAQASTPTIHPALQAEHAAPAVKRVRRHHHWYQIGIASWYGKFFQGKETASGEPYNMNAMTCAHRTLPLGSLVRVTNLRNDKSVVVRVNDRGPMPENRVIDLSYAAAGFLGLRHSGTAPVRIELIKTNAQLAQLSYPLHPAR
uniref:Probable endolytic peptidoglycan transglycosylase RlpA n=1 Tax=Acidobacterium capsulatum TaxID=33075 RepID=A0A7V5CTP6_9BACT